MSSRLLATRAVLPVTVLAVLGGGCSKPSSPTALRPEPTPSSVAALPTPAPSATAPAAVESPASDALAQSAADFVRMYYAELNRASHTGDTARVAALSLHSCQPCEVDLKLTNSLAAQGQHIEGNDYELLRVSPGKPEGNAETVEITFRANQGNVVDRAGRIVDTARGAPPTAASVALVRHDSGWLIQDVLVFGSVQ